MVAVDLDQDGDLDLVTADAGSGAVSLLLNDGKGVFPIRKIGMVGGKPTSVNAADFDGDGRGDLAAAGDGLALLLGGGQGNFAEARKIFVDTSPASLANGDFDGDRDLDLAFASQLTSSVLLLHNDGVGGFPG